MVNEQVLPPVLALLNDEQNEVRQYATLVLAWLSEGRDTDWFVRAQRVAQRFQIHSFEKCRLRIPGALIHRSSSNEFG